MWYNYFIPFLLCYPRFSSLPKTPIVLLKYQDTIPDKWDKEPQLCIDYRVLNDCTVNLKYPVRNLKEVVTRISGKKFLGKMDLFKGYHQVSMSPDSIYLTAFATPKGLYEFVRLPFGLKKSPAAFQQLMDIFFRDLSYCCCEINIDDIVVFGNSENEFLNNLDRVLNRIVEYNMTVKLEKCLWGLF